MKDDVKTRDTYHHGDLPKALISKGAELLEEKGAEGFSMREVARRAGVAVAAPSHHFGNAKGLLTAIATCAFEKLTAEQIKAMEATAEPVERVIALCRTYVEMSTRFPGYAAVIFRWDLVDPTDDSYRAASGASFELLKDAVEAAVGDATEQDILHGAKTLWAAMHGFVTLSMTEGDEAATRLEFAVRAVLKGTQS
jgi:AcrR family transcriptional regulator